jgi:phospholipid/cholesterol/gamma-HCH transport system substrate-binding protein
MVRSKQDNQEVIVGAAVVAIAAALAILIHFWPQIAGGSGYDLDAKLAKTDGLAVGSEVRVSGVKVGSITGLVLDPINYLATVHMNIQGKIKLPVDSTLQVMTSEIIGNPYVAIFPGKAAVMLPSNGMIARSCGSEDVMAMVGRVGLNNGQGGCDH